LFRIDWFTCKPFQFCPKEKVYSKVSSGWIGREFWSRWLRFVSAVLDFVLEAEQDLAGRTDSAPPAAAAAATELCWNRWSRWSWS
jgi:hypothetical protein